MHPVYIIISCRNVMLVPGVGPSWSHGDGDVVASPGRPVIDGGSRGAGGVATQVARSSCENVAEADTYA